jgi:hypothetical protein
MLRQIEGSRAVADVVACCRPQVVCAYPISPQTHIVEALAEHVRTGRLPESEFINVESEFAAMSVAIGASAYVSQYVWREAGLKSLQAVNEQRVQLVANAVLAEIGLRYLTSPTGLSHREDVAWWITALTGRGDREMEYRYFKRDVLTDHPNNFEATPTRTGTYTGRCSELCGVYHSRMLFTLKIVTPQQFRQWITTQQALQKASGGAQ